MDFRRDDELKTLQWRLGFLKEYLEGDGDCE